MIVSSSAIRIRIGRLYTLAERLVAETRQVRRMRAAVWETRTKAPAVALAWAPAQQTSCFLYSGDARDPGGRRRAVEGDGHRAADHRPGDRRRRRAPDRR